MKGPSEWDGWREAWLLDEQEFPTDAAVRTARARLRRRTAADVLVGLGAVGVVGVALAFGPTLSDWILIAVQLVFLGLLVADRAVTPRRGTVAMEAPTRVFLAEHAARCARRVALIRVVAGLLAAEALVLVPVSLVRGFRGAAGVGATHHTAGAATMAVMLLVAAIAWTVRAGRDAARALGHARATESNLQGEA